MNYLRLAGVEKRGFIDGLLSTGDSSERSRRVSLARAWDGRRPLHFDRRGSGLSELELIQRAWPGATYYFFNPLWTLLTPVLRSAEKIRQGLAPVPEWLLVELKNDVRRVKGKHKLALKATLQTMLKRNEALKAALRLRAQRPAAERKLDITLVHAAMLQLRGPQRNLLMEPSVIEVEDVPDLHVPWVRRCQSLEQDLNAIREAEVIDTLAILLALGLEAGLTGREESFLKVQALVRGMKRKVASDPVLSGIGKSVLRGVRLAIERFGNVETHLIQAQIRALPESWHEQATIWAREVDQ